MGTTLSLNDLPTTTFTIGETTYENVYYYESTYMSDTTTVSNTWYYSEEYGLLSAKSGGNTLIRIP